MNNDAQDCVEKRGDDDGATREGCGENTMRMKMGKKDFNAKSNYC